MPTVQYPRRGLSSGVQGQESRQGNGLVSLSVCAVFAVANPESNSAGEQESVWWMVWAVE